MIEIVRFVVTRVLPFTLVALTGYLLSWLQNRPWRFRPPRPKDIA
ncbi:MAG TPA: hypothetical protein VMP10_00940 [Chloroflexota bacterium]|nr:hypothetical protein [Chloroflexota bacterium]